MLKRNFIGLGIALVIFLACAFLLPLNPHISDGQLREKFEAKRKDLEKLASMAIEDRVTAVYRDFVLLPGSRNWSRGEEGFSSERFDEYQELFAKNGLLRVSNEKEVVDICCVSVSVTDSDNEYEHIVSSRGYCFSTKELQPQIRSLDELETYKSGTYYRKIENNWYLYQDTGISKPE
jgi:hypothetical protein